MIKYDGPVARETLNADKNGCRNIQFIQYVRYSVD